MCFVPESKYQELENAIVLGRFPILLHGPSGSGKTHTVLSILQKHRIPVIRTDLAHGQLRRTLNRKAVLLVTLDHLSDLQYHSSTVQRVIFEVALDYVDMPEFTIVHFNRVPARRMALAGYPDFNGNLFSIFFGIKQESEHVNLFRFLGRIFYRKISISNIDIDREYLTLLKSQKAPYPLGSPLFPLQVNDTTASTKMKRGSRVVESSESIDKELIQTKPGVKCETDKYCTITSFKRSVVEAYIHENMVSFGDMDLLPEFFELLSACDGNDQGILALIGCITCKSIKPRGSVKFRFHTFQDTKS